MSVFSERLKELRLEAKEKQSDVAALLGVSVQSYSAYESAREPSYTLLCKIAKHYHVAADYLLGLSEIKSTDPSVQYICEYTGLSEKALDKIVNRKNAPVNDDGLYFRFFNQLLEHSDFDMLIFNLFFYHNSIIAEKLFNKISLSVYPNDDRKITDTEWEKLNITFKKKILEIETDDNYPKQIREKIKTHYLIWSEDGTDRQLADDLLNEEFFMSDLCEYRASKHLLKLLNSIRERIESDDYISI